MMLACMSSSELTEWMAEDSIEPIGPIREDFRAGVVASMLVAVNSKPNSDIPSPLSWFPWFRPEANPEPSPEEVSANVLDFIAMKMKKERRGG